MNVSSIDSNIIKLEQTISSYQHDNIKLSANGGNSMLFMCPPVEEDVYIERLKKNLSEEEFCFIDVNELLMEFVKQNREEIELKFEMLSSTTDQIFMLPKEEEGEDLFCMIIRAIAKSYDNNKIPVLIHTGALNGTGIENIHIMENTVVMKGPKPLVVLYPAVKKNGKIMFLNLRPASDYRCMVI